jgi:hypothetical protein
MQLFQVDGGSSPFRPASRTATEYRQPFSKQLNPKHPTSAIHKGAHYPLEEIVEDERESNTHILSNRILTKENNETQFSPYSNKSMTSEDLAAIDENPKEEESRPQMAQFGRQRA